MALPRGATGCLQFVIVVFPDHTHLLFSMHGKIMEFDILKKNLENSWNFKNLVHGKSLYFEKS